MSSETFVCYECGEIKPVNPEGGTGYGLDPEDHKICYACCGKKDRERMERGKPMCLYLSRNNKSSGSQAQIWDRIHHTTTADMVWHITNWPGTLDIPIYLVKIGRHNIAGVRRDVWFHYAGKDWHGVQYGNNTEIVHCKVVK